MALETLDTGANATTTRWPALIFIGDAAGPRELVDALLRAEAERADEEARAAADPELAAFAAQWDADAAALQARAQRNARTTEQALARLAAEAGFGMTPQRLRNTLRVWSLVSAAPQLSSHALAAQLQISTSTVARALATLEAAGYIAAARDTPTGRAAPRTRTVLRSYPAAS